MSSRGGRQGFGRQGSAPSAPVGPAADDELAAARADLDDSQNPLGALGAPEGTQSGEDSGPLAAKEAAIPLPIGVDEDAEEDAVEEELNRSVHGSSVHGRASTLSQAAEAAGDKTVHVMADTPWVQPTNLQAPPPRPGMKQRWIRVSSHGANDPVNASRKLREGWTPRPADTVGSDFHAPTIRAGQFRGYIGVDGMILCEMPLERVAARNRHYEAITENQLASVDATLAKEQLPGHPIHVARRSSVSTGKRRPSVQPDVG